MIDNPNKKRKTFIDLYDVIDGILDKKNLNPIATGLFLEEQNKIFLFQKMYS